jgi:hypothetical protein
VNESTSSGASVSRIRGIAKLLEQVRQLDSTDEPFEVEAEDELPFVQLGHWVALSGVSAGALALYWMLALHLNRTRGDRYVWPTTDILAHMLGYSRGDKIKRFVDELVDIGAIRVISVPDLRGPQKRNVYRLRRTPPEGYTGLVSLKEFYAQLDEAYEQETAGDPVSPQTGGHVPPHSGGDVAPEPGGHVPPRAGAVTTRTSNYMNEKDAPSARSAADGRRPSTGSRGKKVESGVAASSKTTPPPSTTTAPTKAQTSSKAKHSRQQLETARQVAAAYPEQLGVRLVPVLTDAILAALAGDVPGAERTVAQLAARIQQRWNHHGYATAFYRGEIERPIGAAVEMVRPLKATARYGCANPRCEVGVDVDTGADCPVCPQRLADRQRARQQGVEAVPGPRSGESGPLKWVCGSPTCRMAVKGPRTESGLCPGCIAELDRAGAPITQAPPPVPQPVVSGPEDTGVDEETARLRARYARQYGSPEQVEAYCTGAPF